MRTTIDGAGRLVVPKAIRDALGLGPGVDVEIEEVDGRIEIRPVLAEFEVHETDHGPVVRPRSPLPALTDEMVQDTIDRVRR